ncbi:signal recognition particle, SRP9/SRP14 subunit [Phycomyces blakesleeanus]|uniref:Signal recognition particle, SRP9/SRP14 subunit n=1 Tax=Phycomyces blakesleeanus TaxID=4837 RepID=A0ABR3AJ08_PHYBL
MYISNWDEFQKAAEELYAGCPENTRYVTHFRRTDGELILKVTDDRSVIKFKTNQASDLKRFIQLNHNLMVQMQNKPSVEEVPVPVVVPAITSSGPQIPTVATASAGSKGKKGKKRK